MAADTETQVTFVDGVGNPRQQISGVSGAGAVAPETLLRSNGAMVGPANGLPTDNPATTYQGTIALAAATSTALTAGNVTMAAGGGALPSVGAFTKLTVINVGANPVNVFWFGGTASTGGGGELLAPGASDTVNLLGSASPPSFYSTLGTTLAFRN